MRGKFQGRWIPFQFLSLCAAHLLNLSRSFCGDAGNLITAEKDPNFACTKMQQRNPRRRKKLLHSDLKAPECPLISKFNKTPLIIADTKSWSPNCIPSGIWGSPIFLIQRDEFSRENSLLNYLRTVLQQQCPLILLDFVARLCVAKLNLLLSTRKGRKQSLEVRMWRLVMRTPPSLGPLPRAGLQVSFWQLEELRQSTWIMQKWRWHDLICLYWHMKLELHTTDFRDRNLDQEFDNCAEAAVSRALGVRARVVQETNIDSHICKIF